MTASWWVIVLLVVAQSDDESPQRLPPLPVEQPSAQATAPYAPAHIPLQFSAPALPAPHSPLGSFGAQSWPGERTNHLVLPPPPESIVPDALHAPTYVLPLAVDDQPECGEPPVPGTRISFDILGSGSGFSTTSLDFNHTWLLGYGDGPPVNITPGWGIHFWGDGVGLGLPARVYDLYVDLQWTPWTGEHWTVSVGLTPGLYSDFAQASGDMFQLTGWLIANRRLSPDWQLVLGAAYIRQLQTTLVPVGGVIWTPHDDMRLELIFPKPKYAVRFRETNEGSLWWFVAGQLGGGAWTVADGPNNDALVGYSDLRFVLGIESFRIDGREWSIELGYVFDRQLTIDNRHIVSPGSTLSISGSLAF